MHGRYYTKRTKMRCQTQDHSRRRPLSSQTSHKILYRFSNRLPCPLLYRHLTTAMLAFRTLSLIARIILRLNNTQVQQCTHMAAMAHTMLAVASLACETSRSKTRLSNGAVWKQDTRGEEVSLAFPRSGGRRELLVAELLFN